jgi:biotin transporter BioY
MLRAYLIAAGLSSLRRRKCADMLRKNGIWSAAAQMFNHFLSIAAFGFVAFLIVFVHPTSQASRTAARQTAAGGMVVTANVAAIMRSRLAASK